MFSPNNRSFAIIIATPTRVLIGLLLASTVIAQPRNEAHDNCAGYYKERTLFLLHCCGDVEKVVYPGPRFSGDLTESRRAELALGEINIALQTCRGDQLKPDYLSLQLDAAGAELMKARSVATANSPRWSEAGASASRATATLKRFYGEHPSEASSVWKVIEHWLHESGGPWQALEFINSLSPECCSKAELDKTRGDLFVELELRALAAESYSEWIKISRAPSRCGNESSFSNLDMLRKAGFDIPVFQEAPEASCLNAGYGYYVVLPQKSGGTSKDTVGSTNPIP